MSLYVEVMVATSTLKKCDACGKLIRWPEEARVYAESLNARPTRFEHAEHPVQPGAQEVRQ